MEVSPACEVCQDDDQEKTTTAAFLCSECHLTLCKRCSETHQRHPPFSQHPLHCLPTDISQHRPVSQTLTCDTHDGEPVKLFCSQHEELLCHLCASTVHQSCPRKDTLPETAQRARTDLTDRAQRLRDKESVMSAQVDHVTNDIKAMKIKLQDTFKDLHEALEERQNEILDQVQAQEDLVMTSLTEVEEDRNLIKLTVSSVVKMAAGAASDDALVKMTKSLTSRMDDVEGKADVTSALRAGRLSFDDSKLTQLKHVIGQLGQFQLDVDTPVPLSQRQTRTSVRVSVPGVPGACTWLQPSDQSVKAEGQELAKKLRIGHRVKRSSHWKSGKKDGGGVGAQGTVCHVGAVSVVKGLVKVRWDAGLTEWHRMGRDNVYELQLA